LFGEVLADEFPDGAVLGGAPYNVARHLTAFAIDATLISRTGNDLLRQQLLDAMAATAMDRRGIQLDAARPTGRVLVHMEGKGHRFEILPTQAYDFINFADASRLPMLAEAGIFYFGTLAQRSAESQQTLLQLLALACCPHFLDLNLRAPWYSRQIIEQSLTQADTVKLNTEELAEVATLFGFNSTSAEAQAIALQQKFALERVIVTTGAQGAWLVSEPDPVIHVDGPVLQQPLVDSVGAGDGFAAVCMLGLLQQWPAALMLQRANQFAGAICGIRGATPADPLFYQPFIQEWLRD
jgi:fructokinase